MRRALFLVLLLACGGADDPAAPPGPCTEVGCVEGASITLRPAGGSFPAGAHKLELLIDGTPVGCDFERATEFEAHVCAPNVTVYIDQRRSCMTVRDGNTVSRRCTLVPGQYEERIAIEGTPARVRVVQRAGDRLVVEREVALQYQDTRPNGAGCPPVCRRAEVEWDLP